MTTHNNQDVDPAENLPPQPPQTLQTMLLAGVTRFTESGKPAEIIDTHVESMFTDIIKESFRSYGDLGKLVKDAIKAAMPANVDNLFDLTRYNDLIANALHQRWEESGVTGEMLRRASESIDEILKKDQLPEQISLHALLGEFAKAHQEDAFGEQWEAPEVRFNDDNDGCLSVFFDKEPGSRHSRVHGSRDDYSLNNRLCMIFKRDADNRYVKNEKGQHIGRVYAAQLDGEPVGRNFTFRDSWERMLAALYFGGADVIIDCDADDISYNIHN